MGRIKSVVFFILYISLLCSTAASFAAEFTLFLDGIYVNDIALDGDTIWCATSEHGIVELDKTTGEYTHHMPFPDKISNYWCIAVDQEGIVWAGGECGIVMYDGLTWTYYYEETGLDISGEANMGTLDVAVDINNIKYFASTIGVVYYNDIEWIILGDKGYWWEEVAVDNNTGTIWFQGEVYIAKYNTSFTNLDLSNFEAIQNGSMTDIALDSDSEVWVGVSDSISHLHDDTWTTLTDEKMDNVNVLSFASDGTLWIGAHSGLISYDFNSFTSHRIVLNENDILAEITDIQIDEDDTIWIASRYGLLHYYSDLPTKVESPRPLAPSIRNTPNPFNPSTTIEFTISADSHATLTVYNLAGQAVRTLVDGHYAAGNHAAVWDGRDDGGNAVAAGVYVTRLTAGDVTVTGKMVLVK